MFPPGKTIKIPLNWKLKHLAGVTVLMGVTDLAHRGESGLVLHSVGKEAYV